MGRFFTPRYEYRSVLEGIRRDLTEFSGTRVHWYHLDRTATVSDDVYDMGVGRAYQPPIALNVIAAVRQEGPVTPGTDGLFTRDTLEVLVAWDEIERRGMTDIMDHTDLYLQDRVVYDDVTFTPENVQVAGTIQEMDTIVHIFCREVRDDEQHHDPAMDVIYD